MASSSAARRAALQLLALAAGLAVGFAPPSRTLHPPTALSGIAGFGQFFAESWLGRDACQVVQCPPAKGTFDHVLIDVNQFVHTSTRRATDEEDAVKRLFVALDGVLRVARPTTSLVLALDGAAPIAKIVTQRRRREAAVAKSGVADGVSPLLITPGTAFMDFVSEAVEHYAASRLARRDSLANVTAYVSCVRHGGEGELKLVEWLRRAGVRGTAAVVSGDADVVLQSLAALQFGSDERLLEPFVLRPLERPTYGVVSSWQLARELARRFPSAAVRKTRDDVLVLLLLQGNDYVPRLRFGSFERCLRAYEKTKLAFGGDAGDEAHFFGYGADRSEWRADFASSFFATLASLRSATAPNTPSKPAPSTDDLRSLNELADKRAIANLTFEFSQAAGGKGSSWTCAVAGYEGVATASSKLAARRLAAAKVLRSLGLDDSDAGAGPVPRLREALDEDVLFEFGFKGASPAEARLWTCVASLELCGDDRVLDASAAAATKKAAKAKAASLLHDAAFGAKTRAADGAERRKTPAAPDAARYVEGLAWSLDMYVRGATDDGAFRYAGRAPSARDLARLFRDGHAPAKPAVAGAPEPLSADVHCCAVMPAATTRLLPENLQPLHEHLCEARAAGVDADDLSYLTAVARTLNVANAVLGGGDQRSWTTYRRTYGDEASRHPPPRPNAPPGAPRYRRPLPAAPRILVRSDTDLDEGPASRGDVVESAVARQRTNRDLRARKFHTAFRRPPRHPARRRPDAKPRRARRVAGPSPS